MTEAESFPYRSEDSDRPAASSLPFLPISLTTDHGTVQAEALLDTGSSINVLPFETGLRLGALWAPGAPKLALAGNLARFPAQPLLVDVRIRGFEPVRMAFAWTRSDDAPLIFGQVNFFLEFNVCFFRDAGYFELRPKQ